MKSALSIGGAGALAATTNLISLTGTASAGHGIDFATRENRQHAWGAFLDRDHRNIPAPPRYHVLLFMNYQGAGEPTAEDRLEMEAALRQLEEAFDWGNEGLLFTTNYSTEYFDRFTEDLPAGVDLRTAQAVIDAVSIDDEDPVAEPYDMFIDLASDNVSNLLAAEEALWGEVDELNGVAIEATLEGIFERPTAYPDRRTGFVGAGAPREEFEDPDIPERAPLSMGFESVFDDNIPAEDGVTMFHDQRLGADNPMPPGVFAQGSVQHASNLSLDIDTWYEQSHEERANRMFSPHHSSGEVGEVGDGLGTTSGLDDLPMRDADAADDVARRTQEDAEQLGVVGHAQKLARARFDLARRFVDGEPDGTDDTTILRRDFNTADVGKSGLHFLALMRFNGYMVYVRQSMNGVEFSADESIPNTTDSAINHEDVDIAIEDDGFLAFIETLRRGNFLVPPLTLRSLPPANAVQAAIDVLSDSSTAPEGTIDTGVETVTLTVTDDGGATLDPATARHVRFGPIEVVNKARGTAPTSIDQENGSTTLTFDVADLNFAAGEQEAKLLWIDGDGMPVEATRSVFVDTESLLVNNYNGDPAWPGENDLGQWNGAGNLENGGGQGEVIDESLVLEYDNAGWVVEKVGVDISEFSDLVLRIRGENGGEEDEFEFDFGGVRTTFANVADSPITTSFTEVTVDLDAAGVDTSSPDELRFNFWEGESGASTLYVDEIRIE